MDENEITIYEGTHDMPTIDRDLDCIDGAFNESSFPVGDTIAQLPAVGNGENGGTGNSGVYYVADKAFFKTGGSIPYVIPDNSLVTYERAREEHFKAMDAAEAAEIIKVTFSGISTLPQTKTSSIPASFARHIDASYEVVRCFLSNPSAQLGNWTVTTGDNSVTISGNISGTTDVILYLASPGDGGIL